MWHFLEPDTGLMHVLPVFEVEIRDGYYILWLTIAINYFLELLDI